MSWIKNNQNIENKHSGSVHKFFKIVTWFFLLVSLLMLAYVYYRAEIVFQGALYNKFIKYYAVSIIAIVSFALILRIGHKTRANIVLIIISFAVGIYLMEASIYFFEKRSFVSEVDRLKIAASKQEIEFDSRTKIQVIHDMRNNGKDVFPQIHPSYILARSNLDGIFPLGGLSNRTTIGSNEGEGYMIFQTDRYGFNNPDYEWDSKYTDYMLVGDSFTQGVAVQQGKDIAGQIRRTTGSSVINLGKSGNGPLIELAALKEYAEIKKPKKTIWIYYEGNDLGYDLRKEKFNALLMNYLEQDFTQGLIQRQTQIDNVLLKYIANEEKYFVSKINDDISKKMEIMTSLLKLSHIRKTMHTDNYAEDSLQLFKHIIKQAKIRVSKWDGELYFVYLPNNRRYASLVTDGDTYKERRKVFSMISKLGIPIIDIHDDVFSKHPDILSLFPLRVTFNHYNAEGYNEVAKAIVAGVKKYENQNTPENPISR